MTVTRAVILDLWPLYLSDDASPETLALVDAFLASDPAFAAELRRPADLPTAPGPPPDVETEALARLRKRLRGYPILLMFAMMFSCFAFGRIISDTSWDVSPRNFIAMATLAITFWIAYCVSLWRMRARILIVPGRKRRS